MARVAFDPFEALGLPRDASGHTIKLRYHALARRYHPNRHQGSDEAKVALSEHFHQVYQAWRMLSNANNRRRRAELLKLLELQDEMLLHYVELLEADSPSEQHHEHHVRHTTNSHADMEGYISSDADEDLPHVGLQRRQTVLKRGGAHGAVHLGDNEQSNPSGVAPSLKQVKIVIPETNKTDNPKATDYFTQRRKKLEKLRKKELDAFLDYRDAMVTKFEAEEEAEKQQELYERAKWKREYFERAPRETTERLRSFQRFMGAFRALSEAKQHSNSTGGYGILSPITGPPEAGQFLIPDNVLSRKKSVHKRGWSNDISGDQTSSDSESDVPAVGRKFSPPGGRRHENRRGRDPTLATFRHPPTRLLTQHADSRPSPPTANGFKLVVRQATDLNAHSEQDSSAESPSGSSRSLSLQPGGRETSFTMVASLGAAELFGVSRDGRARSLSPAGHRRASSQSRSDQDSHNTSSELCQFIDKQMGRPRHHHVPMEHVHLLSLREKSWMLESAPDGEIDPNDLLQRLSQLDVNVAAKFMVKLDIVADFNFRLIYNHREVTKQQHQTFIALSYRRKLHVEKHQHHYTLPLDPEIFQAVWDERQSDNEGVWIDQICIDQESDEERTISMSAMDMVYRSARLIVVALDDIELEAHEGVLLQNHMEEYASMVHVAPRQRFRRKQPPYLESHDDLYQVVRKMLQSSWFRRAWCRHEMKLANGHIFLIPCKRPGSWTGRDVLRFNGRCIAHLLALSTEVPFESEVERVKAALHAFFRDRSKMAIGDTEMRSHHGNFSTVVAEVFAMEAGGDPRIAAEQRESDARKDKISIILNTLECGLALQQRFRHPAVLLTENECFHDLLLVALAAQDPGSLCSVGGPLPASDIATSWLYTPTVADAGLNNSKTLQRIPAKAEFVSQTSGPEHFIQLDLKFFKEGQAMHPKQDGDAETLDLARRFVAVCEHHKWGRNRKRYLIDDRQAKRLFGDMRTIYIETLACVLHCGPEWMSDVCQRYSMSRWKVDLQGAYGLLIALRNTVGRWPETAWSERAAGFIMDFVNFLIIRGLPQRQLTKLEPWRPIWVETRPGGKVITFIPLNNQNIRTAVPTVLSNPDYVHLARLWVLEPKDSVNRHHIAPGTVVENHTEWTLLGKSVVFSDEVSIEQMHDIAGDFKSQQKVFGRCRQASSAVARDKGHILSL